MLFFSFPFEINSFFYFIDQQAEVGQETNKQTKKSVIGQDSKGDGHCHTHHVLLLNVIFFSIICYKKP